MVKEEKMLPRGRGRGGMGGEYLICANRLPLSIPWSWVGGHNMEVGGSNMVALAWGKDHHIDKTDDVIFLSTIYCVYVFTGSNSYNHLYAMYIYIMHYHSFMSCILLMFCIYYGLIVGGIHVASWLPLS